jgi:hypothetical protein
MATLATHPWHRWHTGTRPLVGHRTKNGKLKPPPPDDEPDTPGPGWTKAAIVEWLDARGVTIEDRALSRLTKSELLDLVDDVMSP